MGHAEHDHAAQFRDRFWLSLLLALPVVGFSPMFADLLGYGLPPGTAWISPVLGTVVFFYGGWPFLTGAWSELRARQPGMMLLIALAITVAFGASAADLARHWWRRPGLLVGAGAACRDHAARPLAGDARASATPRVPSTRWRPCCPTARSGSRTTGQ